MLSNLLTEHHRLGHYVVGSNIFFNKSDALMMASVTKDTVNWNFNDDVFSSFDWSTPIDTSLAELYRQRAQQLRDKYDYISLYFSGGVDSGNVLHSFIDNNILLDEIIMYRPKVLESTFNTTDRTNYNLFSEIKFAAEPHLRKYVKDPRTKIRTIDMDESIYGFMNDSNLVSQFHLINAFQPATLVRLSMSINDPVWNKMYSSGKSICHLHGVDKPMVKKLADGKYSFQFLDLPLVNAVQTEARYNTDLTEMINTHQYQEMFYWTPDLPQLVIKQCQVVKELSKINSTYDKLFENSDRWKQDKFAFMYSWIYPQHVVSLRDDFCTEKNGLDLYSGQQQWFYEKMPEHTKGTFNSVITHLQDSIDTRFFRGPNNTNYYLEDPDVGSPKTSLRTLRSKEYIL